MQCEYSFCYPLPFPFPTLSHSPPALAYLNSTTIKNVLDFCLPQSADTQHVPDLHIHRVATLAAPLHPPLSLLHLSVLPSLRLSTQSNKFQPCFNIYQSVLKFELLQLQLRIGTGKQSFSHPLPGETLVRCSKNLPTYTPGPNCVRASRRGAWRKVAASLLS